MGLQEQIEILKQKHPDWFTNEEGCDLKGVQMAASPKPALTPKAPEIKEEPHQPTLWAEVADVDDSDRCEIIE